MSRLETKQPSGRAIAEIRLFVERAFELNQVHDDKKHELKLRLRIADCITITKSSKHIIHHISVEILHKQGLKTILTTHLEKMQTGESSSSKNHGLLYEATQ